MIDDVSQTFFDLLTEWNNADSIGNEDLLSAILPLMSQIAEVHTAGKVAPLFPVSGLLADNGHLFFQQANATAVTTIATVANRKDNSAKHGIKVIEELNVVSDDATGLAVTDSKVADAATASPRFLTGYRSWEVAAGHHDPITDVYALGMIIASLATGLDFREQDQLETFIRHRRDLSRLNNRLSPVICRGIERMTELERFDRVQDIPTLIRAFENHRMIGSVFENELSTSAAFGSEGKQPKGELLKRLRARLYDMTRRNRLIYHKPVSTELNLTETSVPLVMNFSAIKPDDLFTSNTKAMAQLIAGKEVALRDYIRFEEMLFAPSVLAKIRSESARVAREYGAPPLRLVPVFLRWYDLKNDPDIPISSPLLLLRCELKRRKGVKDVYTLSLQDSVAEVNPALSFALEKLYGMKLPTTVDLSKANALSDLHRLIETQILTSEPGVRLEYGDKPRLRILHQKVRRRLDQFNKRRMKVTAGIKSRAGMAYSYDHPGFNPLGLQLFREYVTPAKAPNQALMGRPLPRMFNRSHMVDPAVTEKEATVFDHDQRTTGRFNWSFDLCSVTLANFNYRKMSLVRDYDAMLNGDLPANDAFDLLFDKQSYEVESLPSLPKPDKRYPVIDMDPSQEKSVLSARNGQSYVIQGPPGTGKSQTITNLIADFIGQGKRVLFVCEKRAALDVVFNRLRGIGLGSLCSLVHDSQQNKREFIQELEGIYTRWTTTQPETTQAELDEERTRLLARINSVQSDIRVFIDAMTASAHGSDQTLYSVIDNAVEAVPPALNDQDRAALPTLTDWLEHKDAVERAMAGVIRMTGASSLSKRPERLIAAPLWASDTILDDVPKVAASLASRAAKLGDVSAHLFGDVTSAADVFAQITFAARVAPMAEVGALGVLDPDSSESRRLTGDRRQLADKMRIVEQMQGKTAHWSNKLSPDETSSGLRLAQAKEGKLFAFLSGDWRRLRKLVEDRTDVSDKAIKPSIVERLIDLQNEHEAVAEYAETARQIAIRHGFDDYDTFNAILDERATGRMQEGMAVDPVMDAIKDDTGVAERHVLALARFAPIVTALLAEAEGVLDGLDTLVWSALPDALATLSESGPILHDLKFLFEPLAGAPASIWTGLRNMDLQADQMDVAILHETVRRSVVKTPGLSAIGPNALQDARLKIAACRRELQDVNAKLLELRAIERFGSHIALTGEMDRNLSMEDRERKSRYAKARRALEHEFKKTRAYRSPREMLDGPAGALLPDIKPIWLMSPLSVADVLPLESDLFDVVIFDEASQIPVEDAVPTLLRAPQIIVVGDEKQLPPSRFFGTNDQEEGFDDDDDDLDFELNQDSFLTLAAERLKSSMLSWHYRSRSEELIGFSNQAFYSGRLLTIPSLNRTRVRPEITVVDVETPPMTADAILARPISYHFVENGLYALRRNTDEATYIAHILRDILAQENGKTIGIVAFSEAQQSEIESALNRLAGHDPVFSRQLEAEFEREEDGEFIGLFVKNLENVQGDERDIILLSICYAPAANGKMRMNFGPINKMGGEKRLNVIFSRAKENMIVVSSIKSPQITNDYNQGANALKTFLRYAQMMSVGEQQSARIALNALAGFNREETRTESGAVRHLAQALAAKGLFVETQVGLSEFAVDIAVRAQEADDFKLAVLLDTPRSYRNHDTRETLTERATLLEAFGWQVIYVPIKDIWADLDRIVNDIKTATT